MGISRKFQRSKSKYTLSQKIISAVTAAGFIMQPVVAFAQAITKPVDNGTINVKGNVTNIWADKVVGDAAVNVFNQFQLDANNIANMYFKDLQNNSANNLVNFVNSRIDINGTVNAIQNNKIGGNLFFLSKDGMAVGKSGVINTGSLYVMTPTENTMNAMMTAFGSSVAADDDTAVEYINNITAKNWQAIPVNPSGTISVLGQVNAVNEVEMRAAKIGIGKNVSGEDLNDGDNGAVGTKAGEIVRAAAIRSGVTNFSNFVNLTAEQQKDAGITNLTATVDNNSGDIVLTAYNDNTGVQSDATIVDDLVDWGSNTFTKHDFVVSVENYGTVDAAGEADISAVAVNSNVNENGTSNGKSAAQLATVDASVVIDGTVKAANDVKIKAEAVNKYIDDTGIFKEYLQTGSTLVSPIVGDVAYSKLETNASVKVGENATVESTAGYVNISADAETLAASAASATGLRYATVAQAADKIPAVATVYTNAQNKAVVDIDGTVTAKNDLNVSADGRLTVDAENKMSVYGTNANEMGVGVTVANVSNTAQVNIGKDEDAAVKKTLEAGNNLNVNANAESDFQSAVKIQLGDESAAALAVNVALFNSDASVNVDTALNAGNGLNVNAQNVIKADTATAENGVGLGKWASSAYDVTVGKAMDSNSLSGMSTYIKNLFSGSKVGEDAAASEDGSLLKSFNLSEYFKAGASVVYSGQQHDSSVTIGKNANLTAGGALAANAATHIEDAHMVASGSTNSFDDNSQTNAVINASVLINDMNNTSSVTVENGDDTAAPVLNGKAGVNLTSNVQFDYGRITKMKEQVTAAVALLKESLQNLPDSIKTDANSLISNLEGKISALETAAGALSGDETMLTTDNGMLTISDSVKAAWELLTALNDLNNQINSYEGETMQNAKAAFNAASDMVTGAMAFADPNSYANFAAVSTAKSPSGDQGAIAGHGTTAVNGAGSVVVNMVDSSSVVDIGKNAQITSGNAVNVDAQSFMKDVALAGLSSSLFTNAGGNAASVGASLIYSVFNTDTAAVVADGVQLTGGSIDVKAANEINHVSVAGGAGSGVAGSQHSEGFVLNGMVTLVNGSSNVLAMVDDGAQLTANQNTVKDENGEDETTSGEVTINGHNNTGIVNVAAGANYGSGSAAVGAALAYTDFGVKNIAGVDDVANRSNALFGTNENNVLGNSHTMVTGGGSITSYGLTVDAATEGKIESSAVAASLSKNDNSRQEGFFDGLNNKYNAASNWLVGDSGVLNNTIGNKVFGSTNIDDAINTGTSTHGSNAGGITTGAVNDYMPSFSLAGAGSVSLNMLDNATEAVVNNGNVTMQPVGTGADANKGDITVTARDVAYTGSYAGSAAAQWKSGRSDDGTASSADVAGAVGLNDIDNSVKAVISGSTIEDAGELSAMALSGGQQLAIGLGLAAVKSEDSATSAAASASVNLIDHEVSALLKDNTVTKTDNVDVTAYARDIENTGGGVFSVGQQSGAIGATVSVAQLNNTISAGIEGGSYKVNKNVNVTALSALKNITVGAAAGITLPSGSGNNKTYNVEGAGVYNEVNNNTNAFIKGNETEKVVIDADGTVNVAANDTSVDENSVLEEILNADITTAVKVDDINKRMGNLVDLSGSSYIEDIEVDEDAASGTQVSVDVNKAKGNSIITVAAAVAATSGNAAGSVGLAIANIENNFSANVDYADITTQELGINAGSDSNIVTVAGGVGGSSGKIGGAGSVSWNDVDNTAAATIANSTVRAQKTAAEAVNTAQIVSVAGQISASKGTAAGAGVGYIDLDNSTQTVIDNTNFDKQNDEDGIEVIANAGNESSSYNIGANVSGAINNAINGTVALTRTKGETKAAINGAEINSAKNVAVQGTDSTDIISVVGTIGGSSEVTVGAGVAYTDIGGSSTDGKAGQKVTAEISGSTINTVADSDVSAKAIDEADVTTIAVGVGGSGKVAVQGASATSLINKNVSANIEGTTIDKTGDAKADVTVDAQNSSEITSSASTLAVGASGAGIGAGIAVNRIVQQTNASVNGGTMNVNNLTVSADGTPRIENIGVGGGVAGTGAGISGSVAVNMIQNDVTAHIGKGADIVADKNVGVVATSDEQIANYAGQLGVAGTGAGLGVSVSVNEIAGTTSATVGDDEGETKVTAKGNGDGLTTNSKVDIAKEINNTLIDSETVALGAKIDREKETRKGLIVDASSTRDLKSFLVTVGVAGEGAGVTGTVNVNQINGVTDAGINNAVINSGTAANVFVNAGDYTNSSGFVGSAGVGGVGAGVGLGSDTNTVSREVSAAVQDSEINAQTFDVDAESAQGVSSFIIGGGIAGIGGGVAGVVSVTQLDNATKAMLLNSTVNANTVDVKATHTGIVNAGNVSVGGAGVGVGAGLSVGVLKDNSATEVTVGDEDVSTTGEKTTITASSDVNIAAANTTTVNPMISANGVGAGGIAGATSINNINSTVKTNVTNAVITSDETGSISGTAKNTFNVDAYMGSVAGGLGGFGAGVTVNTIDSTVQTNVSGSTLDAKKDVTLTAEEERNIEQLATNVAAGGIGISANIAITNIGQEIKDTDVISVIEQANKAYGEDSGDMMENAQAALGTAYIEEAAPYVAAELGGKGSQINVNITNSDIDAGGAVKAEAKESGSVEMTLGSGTGGGLALNAGVGILNVNRNTIVNVIGTDINAANGIDLASKVTGSSTLNAYQGTAGLLGVNAAYAEATSRGISNVNIAASTLDGGDINILADDSSRTEINAIGITAGVVSLGAIIAEGTNTSETTITIADGTEMTADEDINISAERKAKDSEGNTKDADGNEYNSLSVNAIAGSGGLVAAGAGLGATANELGKVGVEINSTNNANNLTAAKNINISALNAPSVNVSATSGSGSIIAAASATYAKANIGSEDNALETYVTVGKGNTFAAGSGDEEGINIKAEADAKQNVDMEAIGVAIGGAAQANVGGADAYSDVTIDIADGNIFKANGENTAVDVNISADNTVTQTVNAEGLAVGGYFASGTNLADAASTINTVVNAGGSGTDSKIQDLDIAANSTVNSSVASDGSGGALVDASPYAAQSSNNITSNTAVNMAGNWNVAGDMDVNALHTNNVNINADALKASIVGLSGVHSDSTITNNTAVNLNNATVTTGGSQDISARNTIDYDSTVTGSGYGVAQGAAVWAEDKMTMNAGVNLTGSNLKAGGAVDISALTGDAGYDGINKPSADVNKEVTIKSAGVVAGTYADSTDDITFTNNINVDKESSIATVGGNTADSADITLTAADRTNFSDVVTADTQGGVIGAAGSKLTNDVTRTNNITIGGAVDSNYDANFDAGDTSVLNLTLKSNAYNKTAAPLATNPSINGVVTQNSAIDFESGSSVKSFRNINAAAGVGDTTVAKESKTWRWVDGGETGTGSISSTSDGTISSSDAVANTSVTVNGTLEAGKNHELDITIDYANGGKDKLEDAINDYGETLATGSLKTFEEAVTEAQNKYDQYLEDTGLNEKINDLSALEDKYDNNSSVYRDLNNEYGILTEKLANAQTSLNQAETNLTQAKAAKSAWITENCAKYNDEHFIDLSETDFENRLALGFLEEYQAGYQEQVANVNNCTSIRNAAQTTVETLETTTENKYNQMQLYDTTQISKDIADLRTAITNITNSDEYQQNLKALQKAQEDYNEALAEGVSADKVNEVVFANKEGNYINVGVSDWFKDNPVENIGMADYAAALLTRYNEIADMMQDYTATDVSEAYSAEMSRIQSELQALGVGYFEDGTFIVADGASTVPTIELTDLAVSGGNVNITGGTLDGGGTITANGTPSVTVTNNTDFFLHVNDVTVESDGGSVLYNNASVNVGADNKYNNLTVNANKAEGNNAAQITITNTADKHTAGDAANIYTPDIGIYGTIYNPYGNITITNRNNSIYVAGEVTDENGNITQEAGSIKGRTINLTAGGSITQGYSDDIRNVAGSPEDAISNEVLKKIQAALIAKLKDQTENGRYYTSFETWQDLADFLETVEIDDNGTKISAADAATYAKALTGYVDSYTDGKSSQNAIVAGGAIYINAASINVNGTIQSGYESYKLELDQDKVNDLMNKKYTGTGSADSDFMTSEYLVTKGSTGAYYDKTTGEFVYGVQAWYNPVTNQIFTEDIDQAGGGRIYLTGAIANTNANGGKLVVLDGGSNYNLDGTVTDTNDFTFKLGSINADTVAGRIEINDTSSGKTVTTVYTKDSDSITVDKDGNRIATYNPEDGLYYNWSNGTSSRVITTYKHVSDSSWWGLDSESWEKMISQMDQAEKDSMRESQTSSNGLMDSQSSMITDGKIGSDYQYIEVDGSSEKTDGDNIYQISFQREGKPKQAVAEDGETLLYLTKDEDDNDIITTEVTDRPCYVTTTDADGNTVYVYETEISDKVTTTKKKGLLGLWGKTVTTTWKETSGMITAYDFGVKADNAIGIEFVGNSSGSVGTIKSNGNILLGGDINMGSVDITSTAGNINHLGDATVISDNASFKAGTGIDVIQKNVSKDLHLNAVSDSGDINIQAIAANANNMVYIDNVSTGKGNVSITAEGSLLNGDTGTNGYAVKGDGITLQSYGGTIGADGNGLLIDGDINSNTLHGATNAYANGGIYLTEATGNMYLGEIVSENGDVVLEVKESGKGFVDAIKDNSNGNLNSDRVEEWTKLGLLGGNDEDETVNSNKNQITNLESAASSGSMFMDSETTLANAQKKGSDLVDAGKAFAELMKGGSEEVQAARKDLNAKQGALNEAIAALDDSDESKTAYKNALEAYNKAYDVYAEAGAEYEQAKADFIADSKFADNEQAVAWLNNYEAVANAESDNYGWTEQQLMYAVQDSVINPNAGSVSDVKTANVTGNNITFISDTGNLGVVDDQAMVIQTGDLSAMFAKGTLSDAEKEQLEKLASARAGDVTWGKDEITIQRTTPVSVKLNDNGSGTVTIVNSSGDTPTADHIYLLAKDSVLNANEFAANDLRLSGQQGINVGSVTGDKIILEGGSGDIGSGIGDALKAMQVTLNNNGYISANAAGNIMLQQAENNTIDFMLGSVAGTNVDITANGNIVSKTDDIGYINASDTINLTSGSGIGTTKEGLRIKNSGAVVNTDVQDAVNIEAVQDGTLILGTINQANGGVRVESEGTIMLGREESSDAEAVEGYIDSKGDVSLHAAEDIVISGKLHVNANADASASNNGTLKLHADNGSITQTTTEADKNIVTSQLNVAAVGGNVLLDNEYNIIKDLNLQAVGGSLAVGVTNPDGLTVDMGGFTNKLGGDIKLTNNDGSVNINTWDVRDLDITDRRQDPANINGSLIVTAKKGDKAQNADINNVGVLNATGNIKFTATDGVINSLETNAKEDVIMKSIEMELEKVFGENAVTLTADKTITVTELGGGDITGTAGEKITVETADGADITLTADDLDLTTVTGSEDVLLTGNKLVEADDVSGKNVTTVGNKQQLGTVTAQQNIRLEGIEEITADKLDASDIFSQGKKQELKDVISTNSFSIKGDTLHVQTLQQKPGGIGSLIVNTESMGGTGPIESITIDKLDAVDKAQFTQLWATQASVTTTDVKMDIDKLSIEEFGSFKNPGTSVAVFGQVPQRVPADVVFWYGAEQQRNPWMFLDFVDYTVVESNGILLSLRDYWDVYDQRFTAENHLRWQHGRYLDEDYKQNCGYGLSLHNRYGLIDYQDFEEENAGADEIAVDA